MPFSEVSGFTVSSCRLMGNSMVEVDTGFASECCKTSSFSLAQRNYFTVSMHHTVVLEVFTKTESVYDRRKPGPTLFAIGSSSSESFVFFIAVNFHWSFSHPLSKTLHKKTNFSRKNESLNLSILRWWFLSRSNTSSGSRNCSSNINPKANVSFEHTSASL